MTVAVGRVVAGTLFVLILVPGTPGGQAELPNRRGSVKFAAIVDNGTGQRPQYEVAGRVDRIHKMFPFDLVIMLGDNMYGDQQPADFVKKFENDRPENVSYKLFNMNGERYYSYAKNNVRFFALDSTLLNDEQLAWLDASLCSGEGWGGCITDLR